MAKLLRVPEVSANASEAILQVWVVAENAAYAAAESIATIETEKAVVDVESETDGVLLKTLVAEGAHIQVGTPIAVLGDPGEAVEDIEALLAEWGLGPAQQGPEASSGPAGVGPDGDQPDRGLPEQPMGEAPVTDAPSPPGAQATEPQHGPSAGHSGSGAPPPERTATFSSPIARRLAGQAGIPIDQITGTGPNGRIIRRDVQAAVARREHQDTMVDAPLAPAVRADAEARSTADPLSPPSYEDTPHSRPRRVVAARLTESKQTAPHFYLHGTARVDRLLELRAQINQGGLVRISVNDLVIKAAAQAHTLVPAMNVIWTPEALRRFSSVDCSLAIATDRGLVAPVLRSVERMSVSSVASAVQGLVERARAGTLLQHELEGGSFTVTNLGSYGVEEFSAIINPPQASILAVGGIRQEAVVDNGAVGVGSVMRVTLSVDHRPVDGVVAAEWMARFLAAIENPVQILA